ncbi:DUF1573 domain-containing protein [Paludibacter sp. 221]|uniref:DUF1573 domain-containing protein n=1 Tax=Paludibacter sp. 221 TaxID=2302939 RepID=UPI0013D3D185|nr:DUF1573 domain-containing protein [Paludibacter sp. 221]
MRKKTFLISMLLLAVCFIACQKKNPQHEEAKKTVTEWMGKTIIFPDNVSCTHILQDSVTSTIANKPFKILLYTDSVGCTSCKLRLFDWKNIMNDTDTLFPGKVEYLFYFHPKSVKELTFILKRDRFEHPVYLDIENRINDLNSFPENQSYHCFLLDADNKVLSIGNPSLNPNIRNLYKQIISGKAEPDKRDSNTTAEPDNSNIETDVLVAGMKSKIVFTLKNTGNAPLVIHDIKSTCGCAVPSWEKQAIECGKSTSITVETTPGQSGYFNKTIKVYCNTENSPIILRISGVAK